MNGEQATDFRLFDYLASWECRPFQWGVSDCCQFTRQLVLMRTGVDYGHELEYRSELEAVRLADAHGGLVGLMSHILERDPCEDFHAGDPVVVGLGHTHVAGIWTGRGAAVITVGGLMRAGRRRVLAGWCVCHRP